MLTPNVTKCFETTGQPKPERSRQQRKVALDLASRGDMIPYDKSSESRMTCQ